MSLHNVYERPQGRTGASGVPVVSSPDGEPSLARILAQNDEILHVLHGIRTHLGLLGSLRLGRSQVQGDQATPAATPEKPLPEWVDCRQVEERMGLPESRLREFVTQRWVRRFKLGTNRQALCRYSRDDIREALNAIALGRTPRQAGG